MTCIVVCTGKSLQRFNFRQLDGLPCIAVNHAYKSIPEAMACVAIDDKFYREECNSLHNFDGTFYTAYGENLYNSIPAWLKVEHLQCRKTIGFDKPPFICHGFNSGYTAVHLAANLGYTDIRVIGMDLYGSHYFDNKRDKFGYMDLIWKFEAMKAEMPNKYMVTVYNEKSKLTVFPRKPLNTLLDGLVNL